MYLDKLKLFKEQLDQLRTKTHPEYVKMLADIDQKCEDRRVKNNDTYEYKLTTIDSIYHRDVKHAKDNFIKKKTDLRENLIIELEEKLKSIDQEQPLIEIGSDNIDSKITTRKLRRRANEPIPMPDKRRKAFSNTLVYQIPEEDILEDLRIINKIAGKPLARKPIVGATGANSSPNGGGVGGAGGSGGTSCGSYPSSQGGGGLNGGASCASTAATLSGSPVLTFGPSLAQDSRHQVESLYDAKIDDGRLQYDRKWYHRGQSVYVESKEHNKVPAVISAVGTQEVWLRKIEDNDRLRIFITHLQNGRFTIRRRQP